MGRLYKPTSAIQDFFYQLLISDADVEHSRTRKSIREVSYQIFKNYFNCEQDKAYLDFDVKFGVDKNHIKVISNNIITSLWFSGIIVDNCGQVMDKNMCYVADRTYKYNKRNKKLTFTITKKK